MTLAAVSLDDKYVLEEGRIYVNGTQALVRLPLMQRRRDREAGLNTAGFVSGYRGSPLGALDQTLTKARNFLAEADIRFQPGLNEDLAATAILGTQQINLLERALKDGVFAMWYGKGPGVDRSGDAFRHGNLNGSAQHGGVLLLAGDDHTCKSSTTSHQTEFAFVDAMIPVLNPAGVQDILSFGLYGWALSRYSGCWTALKTLAETVDSSVSIPLDGSRTELRIPVDFEMPPGGVNIRWPDTPQEQERRLHNFKLPAVHAFARANRIDRIAIGGPRRRLGIVTAGKSYLDVRQALNELGISAQRAIELGISVYKIGMVWPLEPEGLTAFANGLEELVVVEEKRPLLEGQIKDILYNLPADKRPRVFGKKNAEGQIVLPVHDDLTARQVARALAPRIARLTDDAAVQERARHVLAADDAAAAPPPVLRTPYFCSGCPHNSSTRLPDGSRGLAGIGCHWMSQLMDRNTATYTHMGAEGANWIGQAPFVPTKHVFQNLGDGTYFHSGLLAIRAAIAAKVTMTYKILFNDAVAMTGGQNIDGVLTPQRIAQQVLAEGACRVVVVSDDIEKYEDQDPFPAGISIHPREELDHVQRELREVEGVSVLVYDQMCASEKRRRRKRGTLAEPDRRLLINELVCEACGDCSAKSNCLSVTPVDTEFGRKRRIDQSTCNKDYSCLNGFCPSFVSIEGGKLRKQKGADLGRMLTLPLEEPGPRPLDAPYNVLVTGVGGTGVVTIGAILAMAAHLEEKGCSTLDMLGMAQKGGQVTTHLRFARKPEDLHAVRISAHAADVVLGCDIVVATGKEAMSLIAHGHTRVILNTQETITGEFIRNPNFRIPALQLVDLVREAAGTAQVEAVDATRLAARLLGDSIGANLFVVGYAYQRGLIPVSSDAIMQAIELNGVAVQMNRDAFRLGRLAAQNPEAVVALVPANETSSALGHRTLSQSLDELIERRAAFLSDYQDRKYAEAYRQTIDRVCARETEVMGSAGKLSEAVARSLFKLMAYKDEYEVARLFAGAAFREQLAETFEDTGRLSFHLAPPLLARRDPNTGEPRKMKFGSWMLPVFRILSRLKGLRGTALDPFGYTQERRTERELVASYRDIIDRVLRDLTPERFPVAVAIAEVGEEIRGFGHVKLRNIESARQKWASLEASYATAMTQVAVAAE